MVAHVVTNNNHNYNHNNHHTDTTTNDKGVCIMGLIKQATTSGKLAAAQESGAASHARAANDIKNKHVREQAWKKIKSAKKKEKKQRQTQRRKEAAALGEQVCT